MAEISFETDIEQLFAVLNSIAPLGLSLREDIARLLRREERPKKYLLLRQGQIARRIYFINRGFARAFYLDEAGKEHTLWFMGENDLMISVYSFFTQQPGSENIELLEDSVLHSITYEQLNDLYTDHPAFNYHGRKFTEMYYMKAEERVQMHHCRKAVDRYQLLLKTFPSIQQQASLGQIASYLGITLETLSRLRGQKHL